MITARQRKARARTNRLEEIIDRFTAANAEGFITRRDCTLNDWTAWIAPRKKVNPKSVHIAEARLAKNMRS